MRQPSPPDGPRRPWLWVLLPALLLLALLALILLARRAPDLPFVYDGM